MKANWQIFDKIGLNRTNVYCFVSVFLICTKVTQNLRLGMCLAMLKGFRKVCKDENRFFRSTSPTHFKC